MQAVILAAGQGKRLRPLTDDVPKAMVAVDGKSMLGVLIEQLKSAGVVDLVIVVHYGKEKIMDFFGDGTEFGVKIKYVVQEEMKGTADAVLCAALLVKENRFLCIACDSLFEKDLLPRILAHEEEGVLTCKKVADGRRYGILQVDNGRVVRIIEKPEHPPSDLANFSVYLLPQEIFQACREIKPSPRGEYEITDALQLLIDKGMTFGYEVSDVILDIGTIEQLKEAQKLALRLEL